MQIHIVVLVLPILGKDNERDLTDSAMKYAHQVTVLMAGLLCFACDRSAAELSEEEAILPSEDTGAVDTNQTSDADRDTISEADTQPDLSTDVREPPLACVSPDDLDGLCAPRSTLDTCGILGVCDEGATVCNCRIGTTPTSAGCVPEQVEDCTIADTGPPARYHRAFDLGAVPDRSVMRLFPYGYTGVDGVYYDALVAVFPQDHMGLPASGESRIEFHYIAASGNAASTYGEQVSWPLADRNSDADFQRANRTGSADSLLLVDVISRYESTHSFYVIDNGRDPNQTPTLIAGVTEPTPATWPRRWIDLPSSIGLSLDAGQRYRALAIDVLKNPDESSDTDLVYVALTDDSVPDQGSILIARLEIGSSNYEVVSTVFISELSALVTNAAPDDLIALHASTERLLLNIAGVIFTLEGLDDIGVRAWHRSPDPPLPTQGQQQLLEMFDLTCLSDVLFLRSNPPNSLAAIWHSRSPVQRVHLGTGLDIGGDRTFVGWSHATLTAVWTRLPTPEATIPELSFARLAPEDGSLQGPIRHLGRLELDTIESNGAGGLQVVYNPDGTIIALVEREAFRAIPARIDGFDLLVDLGWTCSQ